MKGGDKLLICTWVGTTNTKDLQSNKILFEGPDQLVYFNLQSNVSKVFDEVQV